MLSLIVNVDTLPNKPYTIRCSICVKARDARRRKELVKKLDEAINSRSSDQMRENRLLLNQHFEAQHMGRIVRAKLPTIGREGNNAARWV